MAAAEATDDEYSHVTLVGLGPGISAISRIPPIQLESPTVSAVSRVRVPYYLIDKLHGEESSLLGLFLLSLAVAGDDETESRTMFVLFGSPSPPGHSPDDSSFRCFAASMMFHRKRPAHGPKQVAASGTGALSTSQQRERYLHILEAGHCRDLQLLPSLHCPDPKA